VQWVLIVLGALAGVILLMALVGSRLHRFHVAKSVAHYAKPPEPVFAVISDFPSYPTWRTDLKAVERAPDRKGHAVWVEIAKRGGSRMPLLVEELNPPRRIALRIAESDLPFSGAWTIEVDPHDGGSRVTTTENGEIKNPLFRFLARFVFGYHATMNRYLRMLGRKLGEDVTPTPR
jgi:uncharacterized protein YndB with AHSA1/START domain